VNCKPNPPTSKYSCNTDTWTCYENPSGEYDSLLGCESQCPAPCDITLNSNYPARFLDYDFILSWNTTNCANCEALCINLDTELDAYPDCGKWQGPISLSGKKSLTPLRSGKYQYIINCDGLGSDPEDKAGSITQDVKVSPLPWWREVLPRLSGFLRGSLIR